MRPERWQQVREVLDKAVALPEAERSPYLERVCAGDPELRAEVESLMRSHEQAGSAFLENPAVDLLNKASAEIPSARVGRRIGAYQAVEEIGHGGMGEVYRAVRADGQYKKDVAIKLVRVGLGSTVVLERFRHERQILASLDHPNIARLLDGGTTDDGVPFLVMELIEGKPIDQYCDEHSLNITRRLKLFAQVCGAVQYAHQHLVIHRDIKPSNILVTPEGDPKLLDFGIAKIVDPAKENETTLHPMTPEYASPEQVRGAPITTSTDVYSLGVVLYQLLTGRSPYPGDTTIPHELARAICDVEPGRPSAVISRIENKDAEVTPEAISRTREGSPQKLERRLSGDLDNIVLKAVRKEPERRYGSVEQLAEDIRRHLEGLPVAARPDTWRYRGAKFVSRHRAGVLAATAAVLALLCALAATLYEAHIARLQAREAQQQRSRAERRFNDVRKLANSLLFELHDSIKDLPGSTPARKLLVSRALEYLDSLNAEARNDTSLQQELATAYERIGDVQGQPRQANLGDHAGAAASYKKALAIRESLIAADPANLEMRRQVAPNYGKLSDLSWTMGDLTSAMDYSAKAFSIAESLRSADPTNPAYRLLFATYCMDHGYKEAMLGANSAAGLDHLRQGSQMLEQMVSEDPKNLRNRRLLGLSYSRTAEILGDDPKGRPEALELYKKAISTKQSLVAADPTNTDFRRLVAYDRFAMAEVQAAMNDKNAALAMDREALSEFEKLAAADPANAQFQQDIGRVRGKIGKLLIDLGNSSLGIGQLRLSLAALEKLPDTKNPQSLVGFAVIMDEFWLGKALVQQALTTKAPNQQSTELCREAESWFNKSLPAFQLLRDHAPPEYGGAERVNEIKAETSRCDQVLKRTSPQGGD